MFEKTKNKQKRGRGMRIAHFKKLFPNFLDQDNFVAVEGAAGDPPEAGLLQHNDQNNHS